MAGIYIHIPFCRKACSYCNFHFSTSLNNKTPLVSALKKEIAERNDEHSESIKSIYFGGGTPSLLTEGEFNELLASVYKAYKVEPDVELTVEANPDDLSKQKLKEFKKAGVNRLSIGVQSFHNEDLKFMDRIHNSDEAIKAIRQSQDEGLKNINIDLIFGIHTLTDDGWRENIEQFKALDLPHLSAYSLTVEENTKLISQIRKGKIEEVDDEKSWRQYMILQESLGDFHEQYELSNYSKPGFQSKHNSSYWSLKNYQGFGPSAHSFDGKTRRWNIANNALYIKKVKQQEPYFEKETLSEIEKYHDFLIVKLRTVEGIKLNSIKALFPQYIQNQFLQSIPKLNPELVQLSETQLNVPRAKLFASDEIVRELMFD